MRAYPRHTVNLSAGCYAALLRTLISGQMMRGPAVQQFEREFARFIGVRHAVGVSSGRAALALAIDALALQPGDQVIVPAYTFHVVPLVVAAMGLEPVFVDVRPDTWNLDVGAIESRITPNTRAILATHMCGQPCDLDPILKIAADRGLKVLEDCAHACGAAYGGRRVGSCGDAGLFTFAMAKNMPCFGGGMVTTNDAGVYERLLRQVRAPDGARRWALLKEVLATTIADLSTRPAVFSYAVHPLMRLAAWTGAPLFDREPGQESVSQSHVHTTFRTRLSNVQAAVGRHQLTRLDATNGRMNENARAYAQALDQDRNLAMPNLAAGRTHTFLYYRIQVAHRAGLRRALLRQRIDTALDDMSDCSMLPPFRGRTEPL
ncbi:MAG: aminotransferase class I/II-fold pyridoxal phosphate-dependent enzyme, partial [Planctomycetes bacterium]|nr:aminotransferase class I/II-fold pyridoxal phosphate-dependent enzyme [Planctomycetota bacterium]